MSSDGTTVAWRRLDVPGHDSVTLSPARTGWRLDGAAVIVDTGEACHLTYAVELDAGWRTCAAEISGWYGAKKIDLRLRVTPDQKWALNDRVVPAVEGCIDVDFAFTPATNLLPIRRLDLPIGSSANVLAAWLRFPEFDLQPLDQSYLRAELSVYRYQSRGGAFQATLSVSPVGFVVDYPGLWVRELG